MCKFQHIRTNANFEKVKEYLDNKIFFTGNFKCFSCEDDTEVCIKVADLKKRFFLVNFFIFLFLIYFKEFCDLKCLWDWSGKVLQKDWESAVASGNTSSLNFNKSSN